MGFITRAIGYVRVSTAGQAERGMSLSAQQERVREYAVAKGWQLVGVVSEAASGGVRAGEQLSWEHRPALHGLIDRAQAGAYDVLLVARLDRLSRDHASLIILERGLQKAGVEVVSADEENGDRSLAEFIRGQLGLVAQLERVMIVERLSAGKAKKKALGRHVHGRVPYGYLCDGGILTPVPELTPIVRRIFSDVAHGDTPGRVARRLNAEGVPSPSGAHWSAKAVSRIVSNLAYAGERYGVKRAHEAIVSRRAFNAAGKKRIERSRGSPA